MTPPRWPLEPAGSAVLCLSALGAALVSQHVYDMQPCPWCVLQRLLFVLIAAVALTEWSLTGLRASSPSAAPVARGLRGLRAVIALSGLAAAAWQHLVASSSLSCNLTWAERLMAASSLDALLPDIFQARANCMEAKAWLLGVPYEFWSGGLFLALIVLAAGPLVPVRPRGVV